MNETDKIFFKIGVVIFAVLSVIFVLQTSGIFSLTDIHYTCFFFSITGFYCPGCGGTRAVTSLLSGDIISSFYYNAFVPYTVLCFLIFMLWNIAATIVKKNIKKIIPFAHVKMLYIYIGIGILFVHWIIKNIFRYLPV